MGPKGGDSPSSGPADLPGLSASAGPGGGSARVQPTPVSSKESISKNVNANHGRKKKALRKSTVTSILQTTKKVKELEKATLRQRGWLAFIAVMRMVLLALMIVVLALPAILVFPFLPYYTPYRPDGDQRADTIQHINPIIVIPSSIGALLVYVIIYFFFAATGGALSSSKARSKTNDGSQGNIGAKQGVRRHHGNSRTTLDLARVSSSALIPGADGSNTQLPASGMSSSALEWARAMDEQISRDNSALARGTSQSPLSRSRPSSTTTVTTAAGTGVGDDVHHHQIYPHDDDDDCSNTVAGAAGAQSSPPDGPAPHPALARADSGSVETAGRRGSRVHALRATSGPGSYSRQQSWEPVLDGRRQSVIKEQGGMGDHDGDMTGGEGKGRLHTLIRMESRALDRRGSWEPILDGRRQSVVQNEEMMLTSRQESSNIQVITSDNGDDHDDHDNTASPGGAGGEGRPTFLHRGVKDSVFIEMGERRHGSLCSDDDYDGTQDGHSELDESMVSLARASSRQSTSMLLHDLRSSAVTPSPSRLGYHHDSTNDDPSALAAAAAAATANGHHGSGAVKKTGAAGAGGYRPRRLYPKEARRLQVLTIVCMALDFITRMLMHSVWRDSLGFPGWSQIVFYLLFLVWLVACAYTVHPAIPSTPARWGCLFVWILSLVNFGGLDYFVSYYTIALSDRPWLQLLFRVLIYPLFIESVLVGTLTLFLRYLTQKGAGNSTKYFVVIFFLKTAAGVFGRFLIAMVNDPGLVFLASILSGAVEFCWRATFFARDRALVRFRHGPARARQVLRDLFYKHITTQFIYVDLLAEYVGIIVVTIMIILTYPARFQFDLTYSVPAVRNADFYSEVVPLLVYNMFLQIFVEIIVDTLIVVLFSRKLLEIFHPFAVLQLKRTWYYIVYATVAATLLVTVMFTTYPTGAFCLEDSFKTCCYPLSVRRIEGTIDGVPHPC